MTADDGLVEGSFEPLAVGATEPRGWLRRQLRIQAEGVTGPLEEHWPELADNQWRGGSRDGWERGPYYADGLVPLAWLLEDDDLQSAAEAWVEAFLDWREESGWIGPRRPAFSVYPDDPWPRFVVLKVLRQYHEATGDPDALDAMLAFCRYLHEGGFQETPFQDWARFRWADLAVTVHWLHEQTGEEWLLAVADRAAMQGFDWTDYFAGYRRRLEFAHEAPIDPDDIELETHVVNNAMGLKAPAVEYRRSKDPEDREAPAVGIDTLDTFHGQATGLFTGDEHFGGRDPTRGTELCAVVEYMYSLEKLVATLGEVRFADRLERIAYNALPATFSPEMAAHQYDQQANQVLCNVADRPGWSNGPDANTFGLEPNYGCCTANLHQGWPKLATHAWMRAPDGLAAVAYAPGAVGADVGGTDVRVTVDTDYPFADTVEMGLETDGTAAFALHLRIPGWCEQATVETPDGTAEPAGGQFYAVEREWADGDTVELDLGAPLRAQRRYQGAVSLSRGPLLFSLPVAADWQQYGGEQPFPDWELYPTEPWNYGLAVDTDDPDGEISRRPPGERPFSPEEPPVELAVEGARVPDWTLEGNDAGPVPASPTPGGDRRSLTLVPYGCTNLRVTEFPLLED